MTLTVKQLESLEIEQLQYDCRKKRLARLDQYDDELKKLKKQFDLDRESITQYYKTAMQSIKEEYAERKELRTA